MICPDAHPIANTIGVEAQEVSFITSESVSNDALQNPLNPALNKNTPNEKSVKLPASNEIKSPITIIAVD